MTYYDYKYLTENNVGLGWVDITDKISNTTALAFSRNITEYWVQELANYNIKIACKKTHDDVLSWASDIGLDYVMIANIGNNLSKRYNFIQELPVWLDENRNFTIVGHILDKGEKYYELHHQFFMVNVKWWQSAGRPIIGNEEFNSNWNTIEPIRSTDNWHDEYTPHWIESGSNLCNYTGKRFGWNIIKTALEHGKIYSFNEQQRESKYYLYPEVANDTHNKFFDVFDALQSYSHFVANTESPPERITNVNFSGAICTAGGITPLLTAWSASLKPGDRLTIIDISPFSLAIQRALKESNCNFRNFKDDFYAVLGKLNPEQISSMFRADRNIDKMQEIINSLISNNQLGEFIDNVWPHINVNYVHHNIFNVQGFKWILDRFEKDDNVMIHLTNMLHYQNTAWIYNANSRYDLEAQMFDIFANKGMNRFYLYQNRPGVRVNWRNITPAQILENKDRFLSRVKELEVLPWIKN
jgi:hypothetical protein